jgi:bifunctional DNA-binding transcriptional regulator/antitoxin component of YhaV-PrlF toxin-antitoxin module
MRRRVAETSPIVPARNARAESSYGRPISPMEVRTMRHAVLAALFVSLIFSGNASADPKTKTKKPHEWRNPSGSVKEFSGGMILSGLIFGPISVVALPLYAVSAVIAVGDSVRIVVVDSVGAVVGVLEVPKERAQRAGLKPGDPVQVVADEAGHTISANGVMLAYAPGETNRDLVHQERYTRP